MGPEEFISEVELCFEGGYEAQLFRDQSLSCAIELHGVVVKVGVVADDTVPKPIALVHEITQWNFAVRKHCVPVASGVREVLAALVTIHYVAIPDQLSRVRQESCACEAGYGVGGVALLQLRIHLNVG